MRAALAKVTTDDRSAASAQARAILLTQPTWRQAEAILLYAPLPQELDIWPLIGEALDAGKTTALLRYLPQKQQYVPCRIEDPASDLVRGPFGILEPSTLCSILKPDSLDLILVPGIAFDLQGHRLGRGRGFYDRILGGMRGRTCGVAFEQQIVSRLPIEPHDIRLKYLLTPERWVEIQPGGS